jgi:membrane-bound metal-dependent hydrolase YbcI (DUF457 family)
MEVLIARTHFIIGMFLVLGFGVQAQEFFVDVKVQTKRKFGAPSLLPSAITTKARA